MKFGIRKPSIKKRIAARTSWKRYARHSLGLKAPRGMGSLTNPRRAAYNRIYNRTTIGVGKGCLVLVILGGVTAGTTFLAIVVVGAIARSNPPLERAGAEQTQLAAAPQPAGRSAPGR
jgi:hypothetical protein